MKEIFPEAALSDARFEIGTIGVLPDVYPSIRGIIAGQPAEAAGLRAGDVIVSINGQRMALASQVAETIGKHRDQAITIVVRRDGVEQSFSVTPVPQDNTVRIGIQPIDAYEEFMPSPLQAVGMSVQRNIEPRDVCQPLHCRRKRQRLSPTT